MFDHPLVILFADRDLSWGRSTRVALRKRGAQVLTAESVEEALRLASESPPDLIVLDDDLPGAQGRDLAELFSAELPDSEIVLLESGAEKTPRGSGLGLLYSGPRSIAGLALPGLVDGYFGLRLKRPPVQESVRPRRILCVDDEEAYLKSLARMLSRRGYIVSAFQAPERALEAVAWTEPDLALVDVMMPGMDGLDLAGKIREKTSGRIPVILITGYGTDEVEYKAHEQGGSYLLTKTESPERVIDVVDYFAGDLDPAERELLKCKIM